MRKSDMWRAFLLSVALSLSANALAQSTSQPASKPALSPRATQVLQAGEKARLTALDQAKEQLRQAEKIGRRRNEPKEASKERIQRWRDEIRYLESLRGRFFAPLPLRPVTPNGGSESRVQVGGQNAELSLGGPPAGNSTSPDIGDIGSIATGTVVSVVDETNMILNILGQDYWVSGVPTNGLTDGAGWGDKYDVCFEVVGTTDFQTVLGAKRTVLKLQRVNPEDLP
jgi:hypothetical protein